MSKEIKTIGILTSGGDAPGMNAAIRAIVRTSLMNNVNVMGIYRGYNGLLNKDVFQMNLRSVSETIHRGGTILYTARSEEFNSPEGVKKAAANCEQLGIDGIIAIGGDGTFRGAQDLSRAGVPCIAIPGTIDNDIGASEYTIGFDTAINTVVQMVDRLRDTSHSHDRCSVVEVMGHNCGDIALHAGIACGATCILVPEIKPIDLQKTIYDKMSSTLETGKHHFIVMVSEGVINVHSLAKDIFANTKVESRATVLGHVQRGGSPTSKDRVIASQMGYYAARILQSGKSNRVVVMRGGEITDLDIYEALQMKRKFNFEMLEMTNKISI